MNKEFFHDDLGHICVIPNSRAKRIIARKKNDAIHLTVPLYVSEKEVMHALEQMKSRLLAIESKPKFILNTEISLKTISFSVKIENRNVKNYHASLKDGIFLIICPNIISFDDELIQNTLRNTIEQVMRCEAKRIFSQKIDLLANKYRFKYSKLSINKSKTRWGSCSSTKNINLSYFCMFLPEYLIDFVILHELCHTIEMNHGPKFWEILNQITDNKAELLTTELKKIIIPW